MCFCLCVFVCECVGEGGGWEGGQRGEAVHVKLRLESGVDRRLESSFKSWLQPGTLAKSPRRTIVQHGGGSCSDLHTACMAELSRTSYMKDVQVSPCMAHFACNPKLTRRSAWQIRHMPSASNPEQDHAQPKRLSHCRPCSTNFGASCTSSHGTSSTSVCRVWRWANLFQACWSQLGSSRVLDTRHESTETRMKMHLKIRDVVPQPGHLQYQQYCKPVTSSGTIPSLDLQTRASLESCGAGT